MVGAITLDGNGNVTSGAFDINTSAGSFTTTGMVTGTYKVGSDWRGILKLNWSSTVWVPTPNSSTPSTAVVPTLPAIFAIAAGRTNGGTPNIATRSRLIGFDDPLTGVHGQGYLISQNLAGANLASLQGGYAFIAGGTDLNQNMLSSGGVFGLDQNGNVTAINGSASTVDMFTATPGGQVSAPLTATVTGTEATFNATTGRMTFTLSPSQSPTTTKFPTHFVGYLQSTGESSPQSSPYFTPMSVDSQASPSNFPAIWGDAYGQYFSYLPSPSIPSNASFTGNFSWFESGRISTVNGFYNLLGQASCNAASCALNQGYITQGSSMIPNPYPNPSLSPISGTLAAVNVSPSGRVSLSGIGGAPTFFYMYYMDGGYMDGWVLEGSTLTGKIGTGELDDAQYWPAAALTLPAGMLLNSATPKQTSQYDASGEVTLSTAAGALASVTGTVDHATAGFVSYGDTYGPFTLQIPNDFGISQAVDGGGNSLGICVIDWPQEFACLPNGAEPNGDAPTAFWLIRH